MTDSDRRLKISTPLVWIPTLEHMAEDLLVMIGVHVIRDREMHEMIQDHGHDPLGNRIEMYRLNSDLREALYERALLYEGGWKLALTVFAGSHLEHRLQKLNEYRFQLEVCISSFARHYDRWNEGNVSLKGSLSC
jgi:hypothetical protein